MVALPQTLILGKIYTMDPRNPEADAAIIEGDRFLCVGGRVCATRRRADARVVELREGCAVPGLADAHGHVFLYGRSLTEVNCARADGEEACAARVAERARTIPRGVWIRGRGWDQNRWPGGRFPTERSLSDAVPEHPVVLERIDGHACWLNAVALEKAGIGADTPDPPGGRVERYPDGRPTGLLVDNAQQLVLSKIPKPTQRELQDTIARALRNLVTFGLTSVHDAGVSAEGLEVYRDLALADRLPLRVYAMIDGQVPLGDLQRAMMLWKEAPEVGRLTVRAVKLFADGALGSRGAALFEPYRDDPSSCGLFVTLPDELRARIVAIASAGFQPAVHAIGDRACAETLQAFLAIRQESNAEPGHRPRLEHVEVLRERDAPLLVDAGAVASMQPTHCTSDAPWLPSRLGTDGPRLRRVCAWRDLLRLNVPLAFGSDFPVETPDPRAGLYAAETRLPEGASEPFLPEQRVSREETLRAYTVGAAHAAFADHRRGMIREGYDADLTLFGEDLTRVPAEKLRDLTVLETIVGGRTEYRR